MSLTYHIASCTPADFEQVKVLVRHLELDDRELKDGEFLVARRNEEVIGFGRIREHEECSELCSLGVLEPYRRKGVATSLIQELIRKAKKDVYLASVIPALFTRLGFEITSEYPLAMTQKLNYCKTYLPVKEDYRVLKFTNTSR